MSWNPFGLSAVSGVAVWALYQSVRSWVNLLQQDTTLLILLAALATGAFVLTLIFIIGYLMYRLHQTQLSNQLPELYLEQRSSVRMAVNNHTGLYDALINHFNREELDNLIFTLNIDNNWSQHLPFTVFARQVVMHFHRFGRLDDLYVAVREARPLADI